MRVASEMHKQIEKITQSKCLRLPRNQNPENYILSPLRRFSQTEAATVAPRETEHG